MSRLGHNGSERPINYTKEPDPVATPMAGAQPLSLTGFCCSGPCRVRCVACRQPVVKPKVVARTEDIAGRTMAARER